MDKINQAEQKHGSAPAVQFVKRGSYKIYFYGFSILMLAPICFSFYFQGGTSPEVQKMKVEAAKREKEEGALLLREEMRNQGKGL